MPEVKEICENCYFWRKTDEKQTFGYCHRNAPRPIIDTSSRGGGAVVWALTQPGNFCGEFKLNSSLLS